MGPFGLIKVLQFFYNLMNNVLFEYVDCLSQ